MTGSISDADDLCQEAWIRWAAQDRSDVDDADAYLVTVVTRLALDRLRSAQHRRETYVGPYLPEPVVTVPGSRPEPDPSEAAELADREPRKTLGEIARLVFRNPPLLLLITAETFRNTSLFITTAFAFYYFGYVLGRPGFLSVFILAISVAALAGTFAATWIGVTIGKRNAYWISLLLGTLAFLSAALVQQHIWGFTIICCIAYGLCMLAGAMSTALFADTVVYGEWKTGKNIQAFTMSLLTLPIKFGLLGPNGSPMGWSGFSGAEVQDDMIVFDTDSAEVTFTGIPSRPVPSPSCW